MGPNWVCNKHVDEGWQRPTVLDPGIDDFSASYPGFIILNQTLLIEVPASVKFWAYARESGHQFRGPDEETADCFGVQTGPRQEWPTLEGMAQICKFIEPSIGDAMHFWPGALRGHAPLFRRISYKASVVFLYGV